MLIDVAAASIVLLREIAMRLKQGINITLPIDVVFRRSDYAVVSHCSLLVYKYCIYKLLKSALNRAESDVN